MKQVKIYNVDEATLAKIDGLAAEAKMSRSEFLNNCLDNIVMRSFEKMTKVEINKTLIACQDIVKENTFAVKKLIEILESED